MQTSNVRQIDAMRRAGAKRGGSGRRNSSDRALERSPSPEGFLGNGRALPGQAQGNRAQYAGRSGATLLLALLILGALIAASTTVGVVVVRGLRNVRATDDAIIASYAAESGIEELLYRVRRREERVGLDGAGQHTNGAIWERTVATTMDTLYATLAADVVEQVDLFDPSGAFGATGIAELRVTARAPNPAAWLEVTWVPWLNTGVWGSAVARALYGPGELATTRTVRLTNLPGDGDGAPIAYRVRFRALTADVGIIEVRAADAAGEPVPLPARIRAVVRGMRGSARVALAAELPLRTPLLGAFDYVLFSECDIVKGDAVECPAQ